MADIRADALGLHFSLFTTKSVFRTPVGVITERGFNIALSSKYKWAFGFRLLPKHSAPGLTRGEDPLIFMNQKNGFYFIRGECMDRGWGKR